MADVAEFQDEEVRQYLEQLIYRAQNPVQVEEIVGAISAVVFRNIMDHFKNESGSDGEWAAWSKSYARYMNKIGRGGNKKLQFNGKLRQNFMPEKRRLLSDGIEWFNNAKTKSGFPYAAAHNYGGPKLPQREFMWVSDSALDTITEIVLDKIVGD